MKNSIFIIALFLFITACAEDNQTNIQGEQTIYGTWQLSEIYSGAGLNADWRPVSNGYTYEIKSNGYFKSNWADECESGTYSINSDSISFDYDCEGFTTKMESPPGVFTYLFLLDENGLLNLNPTYKLCDEGCGYRFKKVAEE